MGRHPRLLAAGPVARTHISTVYGAEPKASAGTAPLETNAAALKLTLPPVGAAAQGANARADGERETLALAAGDCEAVKRDTDEGDCDGDGALALGDRELVALPDVTDAPKA